MRCAVIIPTLNAGPGWVRWLNILIEQGISPSHILVIDSGSSDQTATLAIKRGVQIRQIARSEFDHGGTRQLAVQHFPDADVLVFLTQDAFPQKPDSITTLCKAFIDPTVGAAYGRQLPHSDAKPLGAHARLYNYPGASYERGREDIPLYGIKTAFMSNSFAAYRRAALEDVGGFPSHLILGEDMTVAARMLLNGWRVAYVADAQVYHSHDYSIAQEFRRYFDIGVFHKRESWLLEGFGKPEGEGGRFVRSELAYLWKHAPWLIPSALLRTLVKYVGYRLGRMEHRLPFWLKVRCSMHKGFWKRDSVVTAPRHSK